MVISYSNHNKLHVTTSEYKQNVNIAQATKRTQYPFLCAKRPDCGFFASYNLSPAMSLVLYALLLDNIYEDTQSWTYPAS
jgi:hypothetical protein